jgi:hypothetical protein
MTANRDNSNSRYYRTHERYIDGYNLVWNTGTNVTISAGSAYIPGLGRNCVQNAPSTLAINTSGLVANTWYHVYLYEAAGSPSVELAATAPVGYSGFAKTKTGDNTRRYLGSVWSNASSQLTKFYADNTRYRWASFDVAQMRLLANGQATTTTAISTLGFAPPTATKLYVKLNNYLTGPATLLQLGPTSTDPQQIILQGSTNVATLQYGDVDIPLAQVWYSFNTTPPAGGGGFIDAFGFEITR